MSEVPEGKILYEGDENNQEGEEVEEEQASGHSISPRHSFSGALKVFDAEIMIDGVETSNQGDDHNNQQPIDVEDIVHQGGLQVQSVILDFSGEVPLEEEEENLEGERGEKEEGETLAGRVRTDLLHQLGPPVEHDEGPLGQQGNPPRVHLIMIK